jgi:hypothetical protein
MRGSFKASITALFFAISCDDDITPPKVVQLRHDDTSLREGGVHVVPPPKCTGKCCPDPAEGAECYPGGKNPSDYSGAECLAQRDNTGADHWQLRQTQSISAAPPGYADSNVGNILLLRSQLHSKACNTGGAQSGFIQLVDLDTVNNVALTGFAARVVEQSDALAQGLCFVEDTYDDPPRRLEKLYDPPVGWPKGLPAPQPLHWNVKPVRAKALDQDFDVKTQREEILGRLDPDAGDLGKDGFDGVFFLDKVKGYMHGYSPLGYVVTYDDAQHYNAVPIREAEITSQINDPDHPNCSGVYGVNELPADCSSSTAAPAWTCAPGDCDPGVLGPTKVEGYFLIGEIEQVHVGILKQTLCYLAASGAYPSPWAIEADQNGEIACRNDTKNWNPMDPVNGIPPGDWCATTNSKATKDCHDAWKSISYSTFQAFPIQVDKTCPAL